ncbi:MAG TPA: DUF5829 family protein [Luteitalea sp.]|nr:DUF5829 family protein [Luteitalea sp.]
MTEPLRLNHLYRVVDRETFAAARDSAWLREHFAPSELRTTTRPDWTYTGLYFYGASTYLEVFEEGAQGPVGNSGLAFGVETPAATAGIAAVWRVALGDAEARLVVRPPATGDAGAADGPVDGPASAPWFHIAHAVPDRREQLHLWSMEYHADFLAAWHGEITEARGITRDEVLTRYARVVGGPADPMLSDVTAVTLALSPAERSFLTRHLDAFAHRVRDVGGDVTYVEGDAVTFGVAPATESRRGVQDIVCRLRRDGGRDTVTVGRITIEVDGHRAVWKFR